MLSLLSELSISADVVILGVVYTLFGAVVSFIMYYLFDEFNDDWKESSAGFQLIDVLIELAIIILASFWISVLMHGKTMLFRVPPMYADLVKTHTVDVFFLFAIFIFLDDFTSKLQFLHERYLGRYFDTWFPRYGSIIDLSLSYSPRPKAAGKSGAALA